MPACIFFRIARHEAHRGQGPARNAEQGGKDPPRPASAPTRAHAPRVASTSPRTHLEHMRLACARAAQQRPTGHDRCGRHGGARARRRTEPLCLREATPRSSECSARGEDGVAATNTCPGVHAHAPERARHHDRELEVGAVDGRVTASAKNQNLDSLSSAALTNRPRSGTRC